MSKITGIHHIAVRAVDFDRSLSFYTETLGLSVKMTWTTRNGRAALVEIAPGGYMELFERPAEDWTGRAPILHFCLRTDDVDGMVARVEAAGIKVTQATSEVDVETTIGSVRLRLAFIEGPDGESIELMASDKV